MKQTVLILFIICFHVLVFAQAPNSAVEQKVENTETSYIKDGTKWFLKYLYIKSPFETEVRDEVDGIIGTETIDGKTYFKLWLLNPNDFSCINLMGYIRVEGDKVYFLKAQNVPSKEELMFDYSILPGETNEIKGLIDGQEYTVPDHTTLICKDTGTEYSMGNCFDTITVEFLYNGESNPFTPPIKWIKGIGSEAGISNNVITGSSGGTTLMEVRTNEGTVYKLSTSEVDKILEDKVKSIEGQSNSYHLDGRIFRDGDQGIKINKGNKTLRLRKGH